MAYSKKSKKNVFGKGRRTYRTRITPGRNGKFNPKQKIFVRYDSRKNTKRGIDNISIIDKLVSQTIDTVADVIKGEKSIATQAKEYWLKTIKRLTPVDTGMLRDSWKCYIVWGKDKNGWWLEWENNAKDSYGFEYVMSQNDGWLQNTSEGTIFIPGYHFLEKADFMTSQYILKLKEKQKNKVMSNARSRGGS